MNPESFAVAELRRSENELREKVRNLRVELRKAESRREALCSSINATDQKIEEVCMAIDALVQVDDLAAELVAQ